MTEFPNWFDGYARRYFEHYLTGLAGKPGLRFLQIGVYTGDASMWLLDHVLTGPGPTLIDVDTWAGSDEPEHEPIDFSAAEKFYDARTKQHADRLLKFKGTSRAFFERATVAFDFIYIDGDHTAAGVYADAVAAIPLLRPGGLIAFDDYLWKSGNGPASDPGPGIDMVIDEYGDRLELLEQGLQVWFRRVAV